MIIEEQHSKLTPILKRLSTGYRFELASMSFYTVLLLLSSILLLSGVSNAERQHPIRIGALNDSWGPTPQVVGLRDGLTALGYRENEDFVLGVRFTQGDIMALPAAARELVKLGVDLIFTNSDPATQAARQAARDLLAGLSKGEVDGILAPNYLSLDLPGVVMEMAAKNGIPAIFDGTFYVEHGALASYGQDFYHSGRLAARLVDQIVKGKKPADVPVEVNPQIVFAINLKTAHALGLDIAPQLLYQADKIIR